MKKIQLCFLGSWGRRGPEHRAARKSHSVNDKVVLFSQVVLTVSQTMWCRELTKCLTSDGDRLEELKGAEQTSVRVSLINLANISLYTRLCSAYSDLYNIRSRLIFSSLKNVSCTITINYLLPSSMFILFQNLNKLAALVRGELPKITRSILCALITIDVHARDIVTGLVEAQVNTLYPSLTI